MKFFTFKYNGLEQIGILTKDEQKMIPIDEVVGLSQEFFDMNDFIETHEKDDIKVLEEIWLGKVKNDVEYELEEITILSPIPMPLHDIICVGLNYNEHSEEAEKNMSIKNDNPDYPVIFSKRARYTTPTEGIIPLHEDITEKLDYEAELGVIIGKITSKVKKENVKDHIFGYTIINDLSARDIQTRYTQWTLGKALDGTAPMGPCIVHKDYIDYPVKLDIKCKINGELRQNSNTENFIFDIDRIVSEITRGTTLEPGDIISTGTPSGVGMSFTPGRYLKDGDVIECEIENIGLLRNIVKK